MHIKIIQMYLLQPFENCNQSGAIFRLMFILYAHEILKTCQVKCFITDIFRTDTYLLMEPLFS